MSDVEQPDVKQCCAAFYGSDLARALLGESFHPGGTALTERLGRLIQLQPDAKVLDVAAGRGASALHIARTFGCEVVGIDLSTDNVKRGSDEAARCGLSERVAFRIADAERLPFEDRSFDAVFCECAFCTFPQKARAAAEFSRVLRPEGHLGFSDLTKAAGPLPGLEGLEAWVACIADAQTVESYVEILERAGFAVERIEDHRGALVGMVRQIQGRLLGVEIATGLKKAELPGVDFPEARRWVRAALQAVTNGTLGYTAIAAAVRG